MGEEGVAVGGLDPIWNRRRVGRTGESCVGSLLVKTVFLISAS